MISAFQSREFGFGLEISDEDLKRVNEWRRGQHYLDESAAKAKQGTSEKKAYLQAHLFLSLNMVPATKGTGAMSTWCSSSKIAWTV
jgi:hypothetical protein